MPQHRLTLFSACTLPVARDFNVWIFSNTRLTFLLVVSSLSVLLQCKTKAKVCIFTWMVWISHALSLSPCVCMCGQDQSIIPDISEKNILALCLRRECRAHTLWCVTLWPAHPNYFLLTCHTSRNAHQSGTWMPACSQGARVIHEGKAQNIGLLPLGNKKKNQQPSTASLPQRTLLLLVSWRKLISPPDAAEHCWQWHYSDLPSLQPPQPSTCSSYGTRHWMRPYHHLKTRADYAACNKGCHWPEDIWS